MKDSDLIGIEIEHISKLNDADILNVYCKVNDRIDALTLIIKEAARKQRPIQFITEVYEDLGTLERTRDALNERMLSESNVEPL